MLTLLVALAVLIAGVTPAHAAFLIAPVVALLGLTGIAATVATAAIGVGLAVGVSVLANRLLRPKAPSHQPQEQPAGGVELDVRLDADVPQSVIFGRAVTAGSRIYAETYGTGGAPNNNLIEIIALADHPCEGLVKVFVEGQDEPFTSTGTNRGNTLDDYQSKLAFRFFDGTQSSHDAFTASALSSHPERPWTSDMIGHRRTYARNHYVYDQELVPGLLRWRYVVDGIKLYDPRKDSTVGGSGSHRFGNLGTHEFTQNLIVIAYNILRGIRVADHAGTPRHFYGLENTPADNLPLDVWFAAMNEADLTVDGEPQFHGGAEISVDTEPLEVVREILKSCDGRLVEIGGVYKVYIGPPGLPVMIFNDLHIRVDNEEAFKPIRPLVERINHVAGKYTSPEDGWIPKVAPARVDSDAEAADGRRVTGELDAPWVQSGKHIQRLQKQMLFRARKERRHTLPIPPEMYGLEPGDIVEWTSQRNGYIDKLFEVEAVQDHHDLTSTITILELDEDDYDWTPATDLIPEPDGSLVTTRPVAKVIDGFQAFGFIHSSPNGAQRPAIRLVWAPPEDDDVTGVAFQIRTEDDPTNVASDQTDEPEAGEVIILANLLPDTDYEIRARFRSFNGYATDWSLWIPVTTPAVALGSADFDTIPPGPVTNLAVDLEGFKTISLTWTNPGDADLDHVELWFNDSNNFSTATHGGNYRGETGVVTGLETSTEYWFWAVAVDWAGNKAEESDPATGTTRQLFTDEMADLLVTAAKLADKAVVTRTINDAAIQALQLDMDSVTTSKIADAAVEAGKIASLAVGTTHLQALAVTATKVAASAIETAKIADLAVNTGKLAASAVTEAKLADLAVATAKIADDAVNAGKLATNAVTSVKINALAVTEAKVAASAITTAKIANAAVEQAKIAASAVGTSQLASEAVTTAKIAPLAVDAAKLASEAVTETKIADDAISTPKLQANSIVGDKIAANTIAVRNLLVGHFDNLIQNPGAESASLEPHSVSSAGGTWDTPDAGGSTRSGTRVFRYEPAGQTGTAAMFLNGGFQQENHASCALGDRFRVEGWARLASSGIANRVHFTLVFRNRSDVLVSTVTGSTLTPTTSWQKFSLEAETPAGAAYVLATVRVLNDGGDVAVLFDDFFMRQMVAGSIIIDGAIIAEKIAADAVTADKILASSVTAAKIASGAVTTAKLDALAVTAEKIAAGAVTTAKILAGAVTANEISSLTILAGNIAANAIETAKINAGAVTTAKVAALAITASEIATNAVTAAKINANAVEAAKIASGAVTTAKLDALAVTADKIAANAITSAKILAGAVTAVKLEAGSVEAAKIAAGAVQAEKIASGAVTTDKLAANSVDAGKIAAGVISARHLIIGSFDNLIQNPGGETTTIEPHNPVPAGGAWDVPSAGASARGGSRIFRYQPAGQNALAALWMNGVAGDMNSMPAVGADDRIYFETWIRTFGTGTPNRGRVSIVFRSSAGASLGQTNGNLITPTGAWQRSSVSAVAPANTAYAEPILHVLHDGGGLPTWFDDCYMRKMVEGSIIVDGAILAQHIEAGAVVAGKVAANAIGANEIAANTIAATHIVGGAVIADKIASGAVTTAKLDASAVTADKIAANAITTIKLNAQAVTADKITIGGVTTDRIAANAVTSVTAAFTSGGIAVGGSEVTLQTVTFTATGGTVVLIGNNNTMPDIGSAAATVTIRLYRGAALLTSALVRWWDVAAADFAPCTIAFHDTSPGTGSVTYTMRAQRTGGSATCSSTNRFLQAMELKR